MSLLALFIIGGVVFIAGVVVMVIVQRKELSECDGAYYDDEDEDDWDDTVRRDYNPWIHNRASKKKQSNYDPYDNHWERSFDWKDEDNDGYDDRDDGFWNEREF